MFFMKKLLVFIPICLSLFVSRLNAQQTNDSLTQQMKFYYYPSSNVYYNPSTSDYWYYDDATSNWTSVRELPSTIHLVKSPRYLVYHSDADIWKDNAMHLKKYKVKKNGQIKTKPQKTQ
jgi:hypothetical protein